jgi:hypothetical protein
MPFCFYTVQITQATAKNEIALSNVRSQNYTCKKSSVEGYLVYGISCSCSHIIIRYYFTLADCRVVKKCLLSLVPRSSIEFIFQSLSRRPERSRVPRAAAASSRRPPCTWPQRPCRAGSARGTGARAARRGRRGTSEMGILY